MKFLIKMAFWSIVVLALIPTFAPNELKPADNDGVQISATEAVSAATATVSDMRGFCERQPETCVVGAQAAAAIGRKAQAGAKIVYEYLSERRSQPVTGSIPDKGKPAAKVSHGTLTPADLAPAWRAPQPRKEAQARRPA